MNHKLFQREKSENSEVFIFVTPESKFSVADPLISSFVQCKYRD